jgi:hypothetical protein
MFQKVLYKNMVSNITILKTIFFFNYNYTLIFLKKLQVKMER